METGCRGRGVPVLNKMIKIGLPELFKHRRCGNCVVFVVVLGLFWGKVGRAHYTWAILGKNERLECLKEVGCYSLISQMQQESSRRQLSDACPLSGKKCFSAYLFLISLTSSLY